MSKHLGTSDRTTGIVYKWNELLNLLNRISRILHFAYDLYKYSICSKRNGQMGYEFWEQRSNG
jgi:hypothetical protein